MLLRALFKDGSEESLTVARSMIPPFQEQLEKANPARMSLDNKAMRPYTNKERKWLAWTLRNLQSSFQQHGIEHDSLNKFMLASGYAAWITKNLTSASASNRSSRH